MFAIAFFTVLPTIFDSTQEINMINRKNKESRPRGSGFQC